MAVIWPSRPRHDGARIVLLLALIAAVLLAAAVALVWWQLDRSTATGGHGGGAGAFGPYRYDRATGTLTGFGSEPGPFTYNLTDGPASVSGSASPANPVVGGFGAPPTCGTVTWTVSSGGVMLGRGSDDLGACASAA